jgi:hypothetical protein
MQVASGRENEKRANLMFGPEPGKGGSYMVIRDTAAQTKPPAQAVVDHVCYTISNWDEGKIRGALKAKGLPAPTGRDGSLHVNDPFGYDVQIANAVQETAFRR